MKPAQSLLSFIGLLFSLLVALVSCQNIPPTLTTTTTLPTSPITFALVAHAPGTSLDGKPVNANELAFWIGKPTLSYCPAAVLPPGACPPGSQTVLIIGSDVSVPCTERAVCGSAAMVFFLLIPSFFLLIYDIGEKSKQADPNLQNIQHTNPPSQTFK